MVHDQAQAVAADGRAVTACLYDYGIFIGTQADNMADMASKGRTGGYAKLPSPVGESHPRSKLTEADVRRIVSLRGEGATPTHIAELLGVPRSTVSNVTGGRAWRHITGGRI